MIDDVERYAEITAALADSEDRAAVLASYGLTEETWDEIDAQWQERLSSAVDAFDDDGVPELVSAFSDAYARAREKLTVDVMELDQFIAVTRALQQSQDVLKTLRDHNVTFADFTRANQHWTVKIANDATLAEKLRRALE